jgi:predicted transcriptional regulator
MPQITKPAHEASLTARVDRAQLVQLQELARRDDRSVSYVVRRALAEHVAANSKEF